MKSAPEHASDPIETAAAHWLSRRDRGMTAAEQDAYLQWLRENPAHGAAIMRLEKSWKLLDGLSQWRPSHSPQPNPDLLAPPKRRSFLPVFSAMTTAALLMFGALWWWPPSSEPAPAKRQAIIHPGPERKALPDGSVVELNAGANIEIDFTDAERRVRLVRGEAHFAVAKNPARPFIVSADKFAVRAVGTAFSVSLEREAVSVLVTEGKVRLDEMPANRANVSSAPLEISHLVAGQQAVVRTTAATAAEPPLEIHEMTPAEMERALSWQGLRLEFVEMSLGDVVSEFNRYNQRKLVVADRETAAILVGGSFRADNVDTFIRLLDSGFGVSAFPRGNEIVLKRTTR